MARLSCERWQSVTLQSPTVPTDGETTPTYGGNHSAYAVVRGRAGREGTRGDNVEALGMYDVLLRYRDDLDPTWRIKWGSRYLNFVALWDADGTRQYLQGLCREVQT